MAILGSTNYRITANFFEGTTPQTIYFDCFDNLRRTIATTWSQTPHTVKIVQNVVYVDKEEGDSTLAQFLFEALPDQKLPDHF